ncbi:MAG: HipA domain-containing protein [Aestuariivita sp.]|nr:HipA domain-containing protein [Aestuariivita sp.]
MTSDTSRPREAFVWIWLSGKTAPVIAGRVYAEYDHFVFTYGRSYLDRDDAIPIYAPELPLQRGVIVPEPPLEIANALRDASPDAWGRRVIARRISDGHVGATAIIGLDEITFMLRSGSDRIGALDFQVSSEEYVFRGADNETLERLLDSSERVDRGLPLDPDLAEALQHGTAIGGARPKALIQDGDAKYVAKFSSSNDIYSVVKAEFIAMRLASLAGLNVAPVRLARAMNKDTLLIRRFDRERVQDGWARRAMVSALTLLGLDERMAAHASYEALADIVRARFTEPSDTLRELFARLTFNILVGNTDDHARNHAAFWDGDRLTLTPAYDICPQSRIGYEASQAMQIHGRKRRSQLSLCLRAANKFLLTEERALAIMEQQIAVIKSNWEPVCDQAELNDVDRRLLWRRQFLNDLAFEGLEDRLTTL